MTDWDDREAIIKGKPPVLYAYTRHASALLINFHLNFRACVSQLKDDALIRSYRSRSSSPGDNGNFLKTAKDYETFVSSLSCALVPRAFAQPKYARMTDNVPLENSISVSQRVFSRVSSGISLECLTN